MIDYLRGAGPGRDLLRRLRESLEYRVSALSAFELAAGPKRDEETELALLSVPCLPLTRAAGLRAGGIWRDLRSRGIGLDVRDAMQAGICLDAGASLVTRNTRHFERVPGLRVVEPDRWPD